MIIDIDLFLRERFKGLRDFVLGIFRLIPTVKGTFSVETEDWIRVKV